MRAALLCCICLLFVAASAAAEPPQCKHLNSQIEYYNELRDRAVKLGNGMWQDRMTQQVLFLKKQRRLIGCKRTAIENAELQIAQLKALIKAAAQGAVTFFTMGAM